MQEEVEEPAQRWPSRHRGHSDCGGRLPGRDSQERLRYAALVCSLLLLDATWWRHVQGTKPNGRERMGRSPGGDTYTHTLQSTYGYIRQEVFGRRIIKLGETIYNTCVYRELWEK